MRRREGVRLDETSRAKQTHDDGYPWFVTAADANERRGEKFQPEQCQADDGNDDQPVEDQIAQVNRNAGPGVRGAEADFWREVVAVGAQPRKLRRLRIRTFGSADKVGPNPRKILALPPGRQPRSDVSAA